jgi:hypothetical protein
MDYIMPFLIVFALAAVAGVLILGVMNLARSGHDPARSNRLMQWRVGLQAAAILIILIAALLAHRG